MKLCIAFLVAALIALILAPGALAEGSRALGRPAHDFAFVDANPASATFGKVSSLSARIGETGLLVAFIASWCDACREELLALQEVADRGSRSVLLVAVSEVDEGLRLGTMLGREGFRLPLALPDPEAAAAIREHYDHESIPASYVVCRSGVVHRVMIGLRSADELVASR